MKRKFIFVAICLCLLSSCGKDAASMTVVVGLGIDSSPEGCTVTAEAIQLSHDDAGSESVLIRGEGRSLSEGLDDTVSMTGRPMHCNHAQVLTVSRAYAEQGVMPLLEDVLSHSRYPASLRMAVGKEPSAQLMETKPVVGDLGSTELEKLICQSHEDGIVPLETAASFYRDIREEGIEGVLPYVILRQNGESSVRQVCGCALFREDRMVSVLGPEFSRVLLWLRGQKRGSVTVSGEHVAIQGIQTVMTCDGTQGVITVHLTVKSQGRSPNEISEELAEQVQRELKLLTTHLQERECDAIGLGKCIRRQSPSLWKGLSDDWPERFSKLSLDLCVEVDCEGAGRTKREESEHA